MKVNCSFEAIVGGSCGVKRTDKGKTRSYKTVERIIVPLLSCDKDITTHKSLFSFSEPSDEVDLILCRSALFSRPKVGNMLEPSIQSWFGMGQRVKY